jgi:membrane fusion protein (multidrug efflux system)
MTLERFLNVSSPNPQNLQKQLFEKKFLVKVGISFGLLLIIGLFCYWFFKGRYIVSTDNAYLRSDITSIASKVTGYVQDVFIHDNQQVTTGDLLVKIDDRDYKAKREKGQADIAEAEAMILQIESKLRNQDHEIVKTEAHIRSSQAQYERAKHDFERAEKLHRSKTTALSHLELAKANYQQTIADLQTAQASLALAQEMKFSLAAELKRADAILAARQSTLQILTQEEQETEIHAPLSGMIGNRSVKVGQFVRPGSILMQIVPLDNLWIVANFKETQVSHMKVGNPVSIRVDAFPEKEIHGTVESLAPASGSEFTLLPADNATGNFTKVVQRIPVKITLTKESFQKCRLTPGMSVVVSVNTKE